MPSFRVSAFPFSPFTFTSSPSLTHLLTLAKCPALHLQDLPDLRDELFQLLPRQLEAPHALPIPAGLLKGLRTKANEEVPVARRPAQELQIEVPAHRLLLAAIDTLLALI